jgi:hypothetical protein
MTNAALFLRTRLVPGVLCLSLAVVLVACGGSQERVQTDVAAPTDSGQAQQCSLVSVFQVSIVGVIVSVEKKDNMAARNKVFDSVNKSGADLSAAAPELSPSVQKVVEDQRKRLGLAPGGAAAPTLAPTDEAYLAVNRHGTENCPPAGAPAGGAAKAPTTTTAVKPTVTTKPPAFPTATTTTTTTTTKASG